MRIAYVTTDEVNLDLAGRLAEACGAGLCFLPPANAPPRDGCDAVLYDLDYLPPQHRRELVDELLCGGSRRPVALHSYNLDEEQVQALRGRGVIVAPRLEPEVFASLLRATSSALAAGDFTGEPAGVHEAEACCPARLIPAA